MIVTRGKYFILEEKRAKDGILEQLHEYGNILEEKIAKDGILEQLYEYGNTIVGGKYFGGEESKGWNIGTIARIWLI